MSGPRPKSWRPFSKRTGHNKALKTEMNSLKDRPSPEQFNHDLSDRYARIVSRFVSPGQPYALLDFPDHSNIGDSAIYAGEIAFFDHHAGRAPDYVCSLSTYRQDVGNFCPEGPLFLHGGGNFGTVWPKYQRFRHGVIERYKNRRIVQLAQSIHYDPAKPKLLEDSKRTIGSHPNFTLLVRDQPSFDLAQAEFDCEVILCPDAAHCLLNLPPVGAPRHAVLSLMRDDKESTHGDMVAKLRQHGPIADWGRQHLAKTPLDRIVEAFLRPARPDSITLMRRRERMYRRQAAYRVARGVQLLSRGQVVVSDRLHAHLISGLMGKPHLCLDNSYGKVARYISAWGSDNRTVQVSDMAGFDTALERLKQGALPE